jgi:DNA-binding transcriptional ArsR family regulator
VKTNTSITAVIVLLFLGLLGCGGLRYLEVSPDALEFHPRRVVILPADTMAFAEAKGDIDRLFAEVLSKRKLFSDIVGGEAISRRMESDVTFRQVVTGYLAKLTNLSFSDPVLSERLGELTGAEALILVRVDYWNYTTLDDERIAKVSLTVTMVETKTGKIVWTAGHHKISGAKFIEPALPDVAKALVREMVGYMPH